MPHRGPFPHPLTIWPAFTPTARPAPTPPPWTKAPLLRPHEGAVITSPPVPAHPHGSVAPSIPATCLLERVLLRSSAQQTSASDRPWRHWSQVLLAIVTWAGADTTAAGKAARRSPECTRLLYCTSPRSAWASTSGSAVPCAPDLAQHGMSEEICGSAQKARVQLAGSRGVRAINAGIIPVAGPTSGSGPTDGRSSLLGR